MTQNHFSKQLKKKNMEYSNQFIAKAYSTYLGCDMILEKSGRVAKLEGVGFDGMIITLNDGEDQRNFEYFPFKLLLSPLSAISDEDAIEVAKILYPLKNLKGDEAIYYGSMSVWFHACNYSWENDNPYDTAKSRNIISELTPRYWTRVADYLRSQGYDCGYAEVPSLIDAGLAIDKTTLNK